MGWASFGEGEQGEGSRLEAQIRSRGPSSVKWDSSRRPLRLLRESVELMLVTPRAHGAWHGARARQMVTIVSIPSTLGYPPAKAVPSILDPGLGPRGYPKDIEDSVVCQPMGVLIVSRKGRVFRTCQKKVFLGAVGPRL